MAIEAQLRHLLCNTNILNVIRIYRKINIKDSLLDQRKGNKQNALIYKLFISALIEKTIQIDKFKILEALEEPIEGNPWPVYFRNKLISQDICNSLIEFYSIINSMADHNRFFIGELGAGYGRLAFIFLKVFANVKYTIFDIPPALFISQWYLERIFPDKKIFKFREFESFKKIQKEYEESDIAFFLPFQMELFPSYNFNLFVSISSLGEMLMDQIENYFLQINRLTNGYFYNKQWVESVNQADDTVIRKNDYPVLREWEKIFERPTAVQKLFFEALYKIRRL